MKPVFRPTTALDAPQLIDFLSRGFSVSRKAEFLRPDLLNWKLWAEREDYLEPRSYILERSGEMIAHAGIWPMTLRTETEVLRGCQLVDWASDSRVLGGGVALLKHVSEMFDFLFAIGVSEKTTKIIPAIGMKKIGESWTAARPIRPLRQALSHQTKNWKLPLRFVRNTLWARLPISVDVDGWVVKEGLSDLGEKLLLAHNKHCAFRPNGFFRYLQRCPTGQFRVFQLQKDSRSVGQFVLNLIYNQVRIAGVWLDSPSEEHSQIAYQLAQKTAQQMGTASEIIVSGSTAMSESAAIRAGFRICGRTPIYLSCAASKLAFLPSEFQMGDTDAVFLSGGCPSYLT